MSNGGRPFGSKDKHRREPANLQGLNPARKATRRSLGDHEVRLLRIALDTGLRHRSIAAMSGISMETIGRVSANTAYWWLFER